MLVLLLLTAAIVSALAAQSRRRAEVARRLSDQAVAVQGLALFDDALSREALLDTLGDRDDDFARGKRQAARYFMQWELPRADAWLDRLADNDDTALAMRDDWF